MAQGADHLRSAGKAAAGRLEQGRPCARPGGEAPTATIPAKHQASLPQHRHEHKAFGARSCRFGRPTPSNPGPGQYFAPTDLLNRSRSVGKHGYGSMSWRQQRWTAGAPAWTGPGPGEYRAEQAEHAPAAAPSANFCPDTAVAGTPGKMQAAKLNAAQPGPGSYDHATAHYSGAAVTWDGAPRGGHASAFRAADRVVDLATCKESPPPCLYNLTSDWRRGPAKASHFQRHTARDVPAAAADAVYGADAPLPAQRSPGPGAYDMQDALSLRRAVEGRLERQSAAFVAQGAQGVQHAPEQRPGPGNYDPCVVVAGTQRAVASPFQSKVTKSVLLDERALRDKPPGPAYYSPAKPRTKSTFHFNVHRTYV